MRVEKIALNGFRNYGFETAEFDSGTNVICGQNAQGKTNLLESVYMLSCARSFRTRFDRSLWALTIPRRIFWPTYTAMAGSRRLVSA